MSDEHTSLCRQLTRTVGFELLRPSHWASEFMEGWQVHAPYRVIQALFAGSIWNKTISVNFTLRLLFHSSARNIANSKRA